MENFKVFVADSSNESVGKWLELPCNNIEEELADIGIEEYVITDCENGWGYVEEIDDLEALNELAKKLENVDECGNANWLIAYMEATGEGIESAIERYEYSTFYPEMDLEDVAREIVEDCYDLPENLERYFDYEAFARDLSFDNYSETEYGVIAY